MILISSEKVSKAFGVAVVLNELTYTLQKGSRMGVVGANGTGKTTLFRLLVGELAQDSGSIYKTKDIQIGYLKQNASVNAGSTVWEELLTVYTGLLALEKEIRALEETISIEAVTSGEAYEGLLDTYTKLTDAFSAQDGYAFESQMRGVLTGLGFTPQEFHQPILQLSGGQKTRVALAKLLLKKPDLLLLDEPTNHLDLEAVQWLEGYLKSYTGTIQMISHDRYFLDSLCDTILEIEDHKGRVFDGNYTEYQKKKLALEAAMEKEYILQQREIDRQETIIRRYRSFNREKSIRAAESRQKALDKVERVDKPLVTEDIRVSFDIKKQSGHEVLKAEDLGMSFEDNLLFEHLNFSLERGDRVGILGSNGTGKTTLFRLLLGRLQPTSGQIRYGTGVDPGYYDQEQSSLTPGNTAIEELWNTLPTLLETQIRNTLALFLLKGDDVYKRVELLSGGERGRLLLAKLMLSRNNLLLLDEPTNHLDMDSKEVLEEALIDYPGTLLVVSHDRYFLNKIVNRILVLEDQALTQHLGNYDDYLEKRSFEASLKLSTFHEDKEPTKTALKEARRKERQDRLIKKEALQAMMAMEEAIKRHEERIAAFEAELSDSDLYTNMDKMMQVRLAYENEKVALERAYEAWMEQNES